jgi:hypothetical protein
MILGFDLMQLKAHALTHSESAQSWFAVPW